MIFFFDRTSFIILWFSLLAGIFFEGWTACRNFFFFFCNFPLQEFFLGNCHPLPPPPPVISNGPPLSSANIFQTQKRNASLPPIKSSLLITVERANVACQPDIYNKETAFVPTSTHFCLGGGVMFIFFVKHCICRWWWFFGVYLVNGKSNHRVIIIVVLLYHSQS